MRSRPNHRQRFSGFPGDSCLCELLNALANYTNVVDGGFGRGSERRQFGVCALSLLLLFSASSNSFADEPGTPPQLVSPAGGVEETNLTELLHNSTELLQAISKLQAQVIAQKQMLEESIAQTKEEGARNAEAVTNELQRIERAFSEQQQSFVSRSAREVEAMQSANRNMLIIVATFAATGFLAMLVTACFQWRMSKAWARISTALPMAWLGRHSHVVGLDEVESPSVSARIEDANLRLLAAMERIEKRIQGLEQSAKPTLKL
jgi:hypothetical protein